MGAPPQGIATGRSQLICRMDERHRYAKNWAAYTGDNYGKILCTDRSWTVSDRQMSVTDNAFFMHCLPVRRNMIVTDDIIESPRSLVIPQAANREISATVVLKRILEGIE